jgi:O-antigen/teichoic acid export membrane protein
LLDWILFCVLSLRQLGDSKGLTVTAQAISAITSLITIVSLFALIAVGWLDFYTFVGINMISALVAGAVLVYYLLYVNYDLCFAGSLRGKINEYLYRWWRYAAPLILVEYYTPLIAYLSQYMIQLWYGSAEQGYFALALRWSALVLVFTSSALMIVWREIAHFIARGERERAGQVYLRFNYLLFFLAIVLCFWLSIISPALVPLLAGEQYQKSVPILMMMAFYPVQQTYGQLNTAALKAADLTKQVRNLGFLISIPDLLLTYFLLAPSTGLVPGLGLGSFGVAFRMVCYGLVSVQLYEWSSFRFFGLNYSKSLLDKFVVTLMVGICASVILGGLQTWLEMQWRLGSILSIVLSTGLYFFIIGLMVISSPGLAGLDRAQVLRFYQLIKRF